MVADAADHIARPTVTSCLDCPNGNVTGPAGGSTRVLTRIAETEASAVVLSDGALAVARRTLIHASASAKLLPIGTRAPATSIRLANRGSSRWRHTRRARR